MTWIFVLLMLGLTALVRLPRHLAGASAGRKGSPDRRGCRTAQRRPVAGLRPAQWAGLDPETLNFQPVTATGVLHTDQSIRIFTSLVGGKGVAGGPGYWIVAPLELPEGGVVLVNRGFVPERCLPICRSPAATTVTQVPSPASLVRLNRPACITPAANATDRIDWVRDPARLAALLAPNHGPVAPFNRSDRWPDRYPTAGR